MVKEKEFVKVKKASEQLMSKKLVEQENKFIKAKKTSERVLSEKIANHDAQLFAIRDLHVEELANKDVEIRSYVVKLQSLRNTKNLVNWNLIVMKLASFFMINLQFLWFVINMFFYLGNYNQMEENSKIKEMSEEELRELKEKYDAEIRTVTKNAKKAVKKAEDKSFLANARKKFHAALAITSQKLALQNNNYVMKVIASLLLLQD